MMRRARAALAFAVVSSLSIACAAILDLPDPALDPGAGTGADGSTNPSDGSATGDGTTTGTDGASIGETGSCVGVDFDASAQNCGRCGHDCLGGQCNAGRCEPVLLAENQGRPLALAVDDKFVYWTDYYVNVVKSVDKATPSGALNVVNALATNVEDLRGVAADGQNVYFTVETFTPPGGVHRCPRTGCAPDAGTLIAPGNYTFDVKVYGDKILYSAADDGELRLAQLDGGGMVAKGTNITGATYVAMDDKNVYSTSHQNFVEAFPLDGGTSFFIGEQPGVGMGIAADGERVIYSEVLDDGGGTLRLWRVGSTSYAETIATGTEPKAVVLDATRVYFTFMGSLDGAADGVLAACPRDGCLAAGPEIIAGKQVQPHSIALDNDAIYFSTLESLGTARIWKVAKP